MQSSAGESAATLHEQPEQQPFDSAPLMRGVVTPPCEVGCFPFALDLNANIISVNKALKAESTFVPCFAEVSKHCHPRASANSCVRAM